MVVLGCCVAEPGYLLVVFHQEGTGEEVQGGVPSPMQLWQDLHWGDTEEARDENEGAPGCLSEGDTGEVSPCRTCVEEPPSNQMGGGNSD